jgi:NAD(P)H-nitrite reductase large subunit
VAPGGAEDQEIEALEGLDYTWFLFQGGKLAGAILLGDTTDAVRIKQAVESGRDFSTILQNRPTAAEILEEVARS